jgi:hypothetical protein
MLEPVILDLKEHDNQTGNPYTVAIVDDPNDGKTKLVTIFDGEGDYSVLSLDKLIEEENIDEQGNENAKFIVDFILAALVKG